VTRYFHGGLAGFKVGDRILPPALTGMPSTADYLPAVSHRDRIYATTELQVARVYAALAPFGGRGDVYEVDLDGPIEPDGGRCFHGDSVCAPSATVIQVLECRVDITIARAEIRYAVCGVEYVSEGA
jgi:hypothetical protein